MLLLERTDCPSISLNSTNTKVEVQGVGSRQEVIHSDSLGSGPGCGKVLTGKFSKNILADPAETGGLPGVIAVRPERPPWGGAG